MQPHGDLGTCMEAQEFTLNPLLTSCWVVQASTIIGEVDRIGITPTATVALFTILVHGDPTTHVVEHAFIIHHAYNIVTTYGVVTAHVSALAITETSKSTNELTDATGEDTIDVTIGKDGITEESIDELTEKFDGK